MEVKVISEYGLEEALLGLSLNKNQEPIKMMQVANRLAPNDGGHNKFLESVVVYLNVNAPLYWWKQADTYRVGITKQSESTMHTLLKTPMHAGMFEEECIDNDYLKILEDLRQSDNFELLNMMLPQNFLQRRILCTNYKALRGIYRQRQRHKLVEWRLFCTELFSQLRYPLWVSG